MRKKTTLCLVLSLALLLVFAGGCGRDKNTDKNNTAGSGNTGSGSMNPNSGVTQPPADENNTAGDVTPDGSAPTVPDNGGLVNSAMTTLGGLFGKAEDALIGAFGEGEAVIEGDRTTGRRYTMNILGEEMPVHVKLDDNGNIISADAELPHSDEQRWNQALTDEFGDPICW